MASACRSLRPGRVVPGTRGSTQVRRNPDSPTPIASPRRPERGGPAAGPRPGPAPEKTPRFLAAAGGFAPEGSFREHAVRGRFALPGVGADRFDRTRVVPGIRGSRPVRRRPDSPIMTAGAARARNGAGVGSSPGAGSAAKEPPGFRAPAGGSSWARRSGNTRFEAGSPASRFPDHDGRSRPGAQRSRRRVVPRGRVRGEGTPRVSCAGRRIVVGASFREHAVRGRFAGVPIPRS